jgi:hypothetical protein
MSQDTYCAAGFKGQWSVDMQKLRTLHDTGPQLGHVRASNGRHDLLRPFQQPIRKSVSIRARPIAVGLHTLSDHIPTTGITGLFLRNGFRPSQITNIQCLATKLSKLPPGYYDRILGSLNFMVSSIIKVGDRTRWKDRPKSIQKMVLGLVGENPVQESAE